MAESGNAEGAPAPGPEIARHAGAGRVAQESLAEQAQAEDGRDQKGHRR
jgi:hypothetical protein